MDGAPEGQAAPERAAGTSGGGGKDICPDGVHAARAAALARFDAEEWRREAVAALVEDLQENVFFLRGNPLYRSWGGLHEVTQRQWTALMDDNPSRFLGDDLPVDSLTFGAAMEFLERLNATSVVRAEGWRFRLPSAGEWLRCARDELAPPDAGDDDALLEYWNFTENDWAETPEARLAAGWFAENAGGRTHPVGEKAERGHPADLLGNVRELTVTWGEGADGRQGFLCLGGSWADSAEEGVPKVVLEQPLFIKRFLTRYDHASLGVATIPSCYPNETCPAPGEIGLRLWAEPRKADSKPAEAEEPSLTRAVAEYWERQEEEGR